MKKLWIKSVLLTTCTLSACNSDVLENVSNSLNSAPSFTNAVTTYQTPEEQAFSFTVAANDPENDNLTFSIAGSDSAAFSIDSASGLVSLIELPDFEVPTDANSDNIFDLTILVTDGEFTVEQNISVEVTDVNFAPMITSEETNYQTPENQDFSFSVTASDPDNDELTYSVSGADGAVFSIDSASGLVSFAMTPDFELPTDQDANNIYEINVAASDGENSAELSISIEVQDDLTDNPNTFATCEDYIFNGSVLTNTLSCKVTKDDLNRDFIVYVPPAYAERTESVPMLFSLHGYTSFAIINYFYTGFQDIADAEGFPIIYPQGSVLETTGQTHWNVGGFSSGSKADDEGFINTIREYISSVYDIDEKRVYSTGMSNGGFMSYLLACGSSDKFAAIGSVTGTMTTDMLENCSPTRPVPALQIHGKLDGTVLIDGSFSSLAIADTIDYWVNANNCDETPVETVIPDLEDEDDLGGTIFKYENCDEGVTVEYNLLDALEHQWPIRDSRFSFDIHAADVVWNFVSSYNLDGPIEQ